MKAIFTKYQKQAGVPMNSMVLDCETRWGSVYTMLERALQQKQAIKLAEDDPDLNIVAESKVKILLDNHYAALIYNLFCEV